jgi:prepilin peptidase CpaA
MPLSFIGAYCVLVAAAGTLFYVALTDLKEFKIRNELILVLAGLYLLFAVLSGQWRSMYWNIAFAGVAFVAMLYYYGQNLMSGGDVKILAVASLWVGAAWAPIFATLLAIFIGAHAAVARLGWVTVQRAGKHRRIPLAPSIAMALIGTLVTRWLLFT